MDKGSTNWDDHGRHLEENVDKKKSEERESTVMQTAVEMEISKSQNNSNFFNDLPTAADSLTLDIEYVPENTPSLDSRTTKENDPLSLPEHSSITVMTKMNSTLTNDSANCSVTQQAIASTHITTSLISSFPPSCSITDPSTSSSIASAFSEISTEMSHQSNQTCKNVVPLDMMPTIPLVPVQVPVGRAGIVTLSAKAKGRPRGMGNHYTLLRSGIGIAMRRTGKIKRIGSNMVRGGRRLVHSMSLDDKGILGLRDDSGFSLDDEIQYSQDDMFVMPSIQEKWPGKTCAFCCLGELSQLGQGELFRYDATQGFNLPEKAHFTEDVIREASAARKFKASQLKDKGKSPRKQILDTVPDPMDEMAVIGHIERPSLALLFNTNGQCFAHYMCALWSHGVELTSEDTIACVDKAVVAASERKCFYCKKLGASTKCCVLNCQVWYHFPCATTAGAPMDLKSVSMLCTDHITKYKDHLVDMACMVCDESADESSLLYCSSCGNHYHGFCLKPTINVTPYVRTGWQCPDCRMCQICRQSADEIICGVCDKSYHAECARPQGLSHSRTDWKCKACRICGDCGSRTPGNGLSSRWHSNFSICDSCYQLRNKGLACPICRKAYRAAMQKSLAQCSICRRHVHSQCDSEADLGVINAKIQADGSFEYVCCVCSNNPVAHLQSAQQISIQSPDRDDSFGDPSQDTSLLSDDSTDDEDHVMSPIKPFATGSTLPTMTSSLSSSLPGSSSTSSNLGLSALSNLQNGNMFDRSSSAGGSGSSVFNKGKPFGLARRGGILFPRIRGAVSKFNFGKKGFSSGRKRGNTSSVPTARKGRGGSTPGRGYRGYFNYQPVSLPSLENNQSSGKEEGEENKLILVNANDKYTLWQDVCAMCGAFGEDQEGRLIACAQCGQCYHPYCANVKVNRVVLEKGWRCLDCTVCEGCGERNDEARLVLCEDCDISCHIYCMTPPLEQVPAGIWKCKWCAVCQYCGATDPGNNSSWQQNYSMCGPCFSMSNCPVCDEPYAESELIIQCSDCDRWLHASDDMICTEEEAEKCIEKGYLCLMCRTPDSLPPHLMPPSPPPRHMVKTSSGIISAGNTSASVTLTGNSFTCNSSNFPLSPARSESPVDFMSKLNSNAEHWMDGTCLSDLGLNQIQNITLLPFKKPRNLKGLRSSRGPSLDSTGSRDMDDEDEDDDDKNEGNLGPQHWVYRMKEGTLLNAKEHGDPPNLPDGFYTLPGPEPGTFILRKRRIRNIKTVGIGGFQVRARARKDEEKAREEAEMDPQALELKRRRTKWRTKKKIQILEKFPSYIQEAFFGRNLMDTSNIEVEKHNLEDLTDAPVETMKNPSSNSSIRLSQDELDLVQAAKEKHEHSKRRKLEGFVTILEQQPKAQQIQQSRAPHLNGTLQGAVKEGTVAPHVPIQRVEEKKFKEEKVEDIVEDDENNDAIEALFGACGSALISDDLVRDIMNDEIKDEDTSFNEVEDRDQIDGEAGVDGSKLTDLLGPGFNLEEVALADIMKNLREEPSFDGTGSHSSADSNLSGNVTRGVSLIRNQAPINIVATSSPAVQAVVSHHTQNIPTSVSSIRPVSLPLPSTLPLSAEPCTSNQQVMAPIGTPLPGIIAREPHLATSQFKAVSNVCLQSSVLPSPGLVYSNHPSVTLPSFLSEEQRKKGLDSGNHPEYTSATISAPSNVNVFQVTEQPFQRTAGNVALHSVTQSPKLLHSIPLHHQNPIPSQQKMYSINSVVPVSNQAGPSTAPIVVQPTPCVSIIQSHHPVGRAAPSPSHQQSPSYPVPYASNDSPQSAPSTPATPTLVHSEVAASSKTWSSTTESQSLSLSLEEDEALGPKATKAAVLYTNIHNPTLKTDVALVKDRERQIKRIWKNLDAEQRKIYAQKARENKKEFFKNKQELQRALKNQEKEAAASNSDNKGVATQNTVRQANTSFNQSTQNLPTQQHSLGSPYSQPPLTPRPQDESYASQQPLHQSQASQIQPLQQQAHMREALHQQPKWEEGIVSNGQAVLTSPTRPQVQFRQPLPPMGLGGQQLRMRVPGHAAPQIMDPRMRLIMQQQQQQQQRLQSQQQILQQLQQSTQQHLSLQSQLQSQPQSILQQSQQLHAQSSQSQILQPQQQSQQLMHHQPQQLLHQQLQPGSQQQQIQPQSPQQLLRQQQSASQHQMLQQSPQHQIQHQLQQQSPQQHILHQQSPQLQLQQQAQQQSQHQTSQQLQLQQPSQQLQLQQQSPQQHQLHQQQASQLQQQQASQLQQQQTSQLTQQPSPQHHQLPQQMSPQQHLQQQSPQQQQMQQSPQHHVQLQQSPQHLQQQQQSPQHPLQQLQQQQSPHHHLLDQSPQHPLQQQSPQHHMHQHSPQQQLQHVKSQDLSQTSIMTENESIENFNAFQLDHQMHLQQRLTMQDEHKARNTIVGFALSQGSGIPHTLQNSESAENVSELPDAITRELEQFEKAQHRHQENRNNNHHGELEIEEELLSDIGDIKELLEYAESERERMGRNEDSKMPSNIFDNLVDSEQKEGKKIDITVSEMHQRFPYPSVSSNSPNTVTMPHSSMSAHTLRHSPTMSVSSPSMRQSPSLSSSPNMGPSLVGGGPSPGHNSPALQGSVSGTTNASCMPAQQLVTQSSMSHGPPNQVMQMGPSGPIIGSRMVVSGAPVSHSQSLQQNSNAIVSQMPIHLQQINQVFGSRMMPVSQHIIRQGPPPPPPYPGHPPSYSRPQVIPGECLMVRAPMGSLGGGTTVMRPLSHSPVMGNSPMMMGGPHLMPHPQHLGPPLHRRPLLIQEQPLLIEDIIEEEKREQMKQHKAAVIQHQQPQLIDGNGSSALRASYQRLANQSNNGPMYSVSAPSHQLGHQVRPSNDSGIHPALLQATASRSTSVPISNPVTKTLPQPPMPPDNPQTEPELQQQQQYESWLTQQNSIYAGHQKYLDSEIAKLRRQRKSLNSRQRTLKKNGQELSERDANELDRVQKDATAIQKQLEVCRKAIRQHALLITEYNKKRQKQSQAIHSPSPTGLMTSPQTPMMSGASPATQSGSSPMHSSPMHSTPQSPLMSHSPQQGMCMSPMVPSPHTPVASPNTVSAAQHSPHGMMISAPHPSPVDHNGPFSPQTRMHSPGTPVSYGSIHPMIGLQGSRVRMPVLSPGPSSTHHNLMSPHTMVIRQNYSPLQSQLMAQSQGQQIVMRHQYQNVIPMRRPSGSGPIPSPVPSGVCLSPSGLSPGPATSMTMKPSSVCPSPSPIPSMAMKPSPVHSGLRSPTPLPSPQMRPHSTENPTTPLTPRSMDMNNPLTPHSDIGCYGSQVNSPRHSVPISTPPSPAITSGSTFFSNSSLGTSDSNIFSEANAAIYDNQTDFSFDNGMEMARGYGQDDNRNSSGGGGSNRIAPFPVSEDMPRYGFFKFGLRGGATIRSRWGHFKIGLRGGQPSPVEVNNVNAATVTSSSAAIVPGTTSIASNITTVAGNSNSPITVSSSEYCKQTGLPEEGLAGVLSDSIKGRLPRNSSIPNVSHSTYASAIVTSVSCTPQLPVSSTKVVIPEPLKSDIPPSSRHQAVIGIPGGGAISSQSSIYPSTGLGVVPAMRLAVTATTGSYPLLSSFSESSAGDGNAVLDKLSSSLVPAPIMSVTISNSNVPTSSSKPPMTSSIVSLAKDVNTLATVVNASSQINNVLLSLGTSTKSDIFQSNPPTNATVPFFGNAQVNNYVASTLPMECIPSSSISRSIYSSVISSPRLSTNLSLTPSSSSMFTPSVVNSIVAQSSNIGTVESSSTGITVATASTPHVSNPNVPTIVTQTVMHNQTTPQVVYTNQPSGSVMTMQAVSRPSLPHTLHHLPQQRMPVVLTTGNQSIPSLQVVTQHGTPTSGQIVASNLAGQTTRIIGATIHQQPGSVVVQNQIPGQLPTTQIVQLPSLSQLNAGQLTRAQVVQSLNQFGQVVQSSQGGQLIVQHQHQPSSMVLTNSSGQVRMVGQPVMMQQGVLRGSGVMMKAGSQVQGSVMVKSGSQVQSGVRMMMIHNNNQRTLTPPPNSRQASPMMPPPAAKSPASHSASPIPRVSPSPSPIAHSPSPHSPQVITPHQGSPSQSPQHSSTPPMQASQIITSRKEFDEDKFVRNSEASQLIHHSGTNFSGISRVETTTTLSSKDVHIPSAPNALLKQLLQNACSSSGVPSQLVLVRSSTTGLPSQLSQVATQLPNPSAVAIPRSLSDSSAMRQTLHTQVGPQNSTALHAAVIHQQSGIPQIGLTRTTIIPQQATVISSRDSQSVSGLQVVGSTISGSLPQSVVISHATANNMLTSQVQSVIPSTQYINVRHGQALSVQATTSSSAQSSQNMSVTLANSFILNQVSQLQGNAQRSQVSNSTVIAGLSSTTPQTSQSISPSLSLNSASNFPDRLSGNPILSVKNEVRVMIPETVGSCSGVSTGGEHTPELNTPNDNCDDPDESKKAKKRAQSQTRRKSQTKDAKVQPVKRARQGSRVEEDYDTYIEGMMSQLRAMPPITVMEPSVPRNFNVCPIYGSGDVGKLGKKNYNHQFGLLEGPEGSAVVRNMNDFYNTQPFGPKPALVIPAKTGPTQRGFYNQEFTPPKIGLPQDDYSAEVDICLSKTGLITVRDADSPDTVLSSSSPECTFPDSPPLFKGLRLVEDDLMDDGRDRSVSPAIPLLVPVPVYGNFHLIDKKFKCDIDIKSNKENIGLPKIYSHITAKSKINPSPSLPLKDLGNVTVSLTLSSQASQDVSNVLRSLASLLNIPPPKSYNIMEHSLDNIKFRQAYRQNISKEGSEEMVDVQSILNGQVKFCKQCNTLVMRNMICKKITEMTFLQKEDFEGIDDLTFCCKPCFSQFVHSHRATIEEKSGTLIDSSGRHKVNDCFFINENKINSGQIGLTGNINEWKEENMDEVLKVPQLETDMGVKRKLDEEEEYPRQEDGKRFRGHHYKYWSKDSFSLPDKYEKPTNKEMTDLLFGMRITYRMPRLPDDSRQCSLCPLFGDYVADGPSRLLNYDVDKWVHLNCALWAEDVYETMSGSLVNVEVALKKALNMACEHCGESGASVKCFKVRCNKVYHLNCAVKEGCTFYKNKTVYCLEHSNKGDKDNELSTLAVFRRVYIDRDENRQVASVMHHTEMNHIIRIGSLILLNIGQLLPHHLQAFHSPICIYPIGYQVIRFYWSMRQLHKRCAYECSIHEVENEPEFRIVIREEGFEDLTLASRSPKGVWNKILEPIADMRIKADVVRLFPQYISGEDLFGLTEPAIVRILESMPGIDTLSDYNFKFGSNPLFELPLAVNPTGCARSEPFNKTHMKRHHGMRTCAGTVKSGNNPRTAAAIASLTMNFDPFTPFGKQHSRFFQYKKMKNEWRCVVYLARSKIQGLGLYAARDIEKNTAIIEYIGEIIRGEVSEVREKRYEGQNRGIYMFRLDDSRVVDATVTGGLARYINHSCGPNCFTETVEIEKDIKIVIVSNRKINRGEELAYDYKFDEEEDHKIPCLCGTENCRKWMN